MHVNRDAPVIATREIKINAALQVVWALHTDIGHWPEWHPDISRAKLDGPLTPGSVFRWKAGGMSVTSTLREVEAERRLSWTGKALGIRAVHVWTFEPQAEGGIWVRTEESMEGWPARLLSGWMQNMLDASLQTWLEHLKRKAEETETALRQ